MTRARVLRLSIAAIATYMAGAAAVLATARSGIDALGIPLGFDFLAFHGAARLAAAGDLVTAFDPAMFRSALEEQLPGVGAGYYWLYPPTFALMLLPLGLLPYGPAFWLWTGASLSAYGYSAWLAARDRTAILACVAFSATWVTAYHGQNALFTAALFMLGAHWLINRRDRLAGLAIGLLTIKPHLAVLIPLALAASGRWRAFFAAAVTATAFTAFATAVFGVGYLDVYFDVGRKLASLLLAKEHHWAAISSVYIGAKMIGAPNAIAWAMHLSIAVAVSGLILLRFRRTGVTANTMALLAAASLLISPYVMDYDLAILAVSGVFLFAPTAGGRAASPRESAAALVTAMIPISIVAVGRMGIQIGWLAPMIVIVLAELRLRAAAHAPNARAAFGAK